MVKVKRKNVNLKFRILLCFIFLVVICILSRLFLYQVLNHEAYSVQAKDQHEISEKLIPKRGEIFVQEKGDLWHPLAVNRYFQTVFLAPNEVKNKDEVIEKLSPLLEISREKFLDKLKDSSDPYEPLKQKLNDDIAGQIKNMNLAGVYLTPGSWRWYPQGNLASHVSGFVGNSGGEKIGQYGLEQYYEEELKGKAGLLKSEKDGLGRWLFMGDYNLEPAQDGLNLYLTLDQNIQHVVEQKLQSVSEKWGAEGGCAIVMDPKTGAIRAMASYPFFDPNDYKKVDSVEIFANSCVQRLYEPGSVFKPVVMAAGLDTGKISPETTYIDTGSVSIAGYTIQNSQQKTYGLSTMTNVLEKSINTGVIFAERAVGDSVFKKYIEAFGFSNVCGIDLAGETAGNLTNLTREINFATAAFGQGILVTPLEMASAVAAIANNGKLMKPYLVEKTVMGNGEEEIIQPEEIRQVVSPQTANKLTAMLVSTVRNGYDKIKIKNYFVAGKTGTAQIADSAKRGYSEYDTNHSFVGYAPAYNPKFLIFLKIEKPRGIQFASESLAPVFGDLAQYLLDYYEIPPEQ